MPILTAQERVGTVLDRKYRLDRILGEGGMGVVYAAHHLRLDRPVAVKFLHPQFAQDAQLVSRFFSEAQAAARMRHPNVVDVYDLDQSAADATVYMVLEFLVGEPLSARLLRGRLDTPEMMALLGPVLDALDRAHAAGIVHRDLKPDNIFLARAENGLTPKVLDFGIAKLADTGGRSATATGHVMGTPAYMAPEQAMGRKEIGPWTDVWSMGIVCYEALTGTLPFVFEPDAPATAVMVAIVSSEPRPILQARPDLPPHVAAAIDRALRKDLAGRWRSIAEFRAALDGRASVGVAPTLLEVVGDLDTLRSPMRSLDGPASSAGETAPSPVAPLAPSPSATATPSPTFNGASGAPPRARWALGLAAVVVVVLIAGLALAFGGTQPRGVEVVVAPPTTTIAPATSTVVPAATAVIPPDAVPTTIDPRVDPAPATVASVASTPPETTTDDRAAEHPTHEATVARAHAATRVEVAAESGRPRTAVASPPGASTPTRTAPPPRTGWGTTVSADDM